MCTYLCDVLEDEGFCVTPAVDGINLTAGGGAVGANFCVATVRDTAANCVAFLDSCLFLFTPHYPPIIARSQTSKQLADMDLSWRSQIDRSDEISELAKNLNRMAENLQEALGDLQTANEKLQQDIERERRRKRCAMISLLHFPTN